MYDEITFFTTTSAFSRKVHTELVRISRKFPVRLFADCYLSGNCSVKTLSLKSVLLYQLGRALLSDSKADEVCFFDFLHAVSKENSVTCSASNKKIVDWCKIPLKEKRQKSKNTSQILYISALPQAMSAFERVEARQNSADFSQVIANRLNQSRFQLKEKLANEQSRCSSYLLSIEAQLWLEFEIETQKSGCITFCLSPQGLGQWLQHLQPRPSAAAPPDAITSPADALVSSATQPEKFSTLKQFSKKETAREKESVKEAAPFQLGQYPVNHYLVEHRPVEHRPVEHRSVEHYPIEHHPKQGAAQREWTTRLLWQAQYTYACCARIEREYIAKGNAERLALQEDADCLNAGHRFEQMDCEYWQNEYAQSTPAVHLLVCTLVNTSDSLFWIPYRWPTQQYLLLLERASLLCQAFEQFYRVCLCGSQHPYVASKTPAIAHRLPHQILIRATKTTLKCLLQEHLGEKAPEHI